MCLKNARYFQCKYSMKQVRIGLDSGENPVQAVAVLRPDSHVALVLLNRNKQETYRIRVKSAKGDLNLDIGPKSFTSVTI